MTDWSSHRFPAIEECYECGSTRLTGRELSVQEVSVNLDGVGGITQTFTDVLLDTEYIHLECAECGEIIVEDGEVVSP